MELQYELEADVCCPSCGHEEVFVEPGAGDFYDGPENICGKCFFTFAVKFYGPAGIQKKNAVLKAKQVIMNANK